MAPDHTDYLYDGFISYSRSDTVFADRLERALEKYRPPKELGVGDRHLSIFRDTQDLTGTEYFSSISEALERSRKLIVVCSPAARSSPYVDDEVRRFIDKRGTRDVIPILLAGRPNNEVAAEDEHSMAFPEALCREGEIPLAVSFTHFEPRRGRLDTVRFADSWYGLLANLYGTTRSTIEQRERVRRRRRVWQLGAIAVVIIAVLTVAMIYAFIERNVAVAQRKAAENALRIANSRAAAAIAQQALATDPLSGLSLAISAATTARTPEAEQAMRAALRQPRVRAIIAHGGRVISFAFSGSGTRAATGAEGGEARIWDLEAGKEIARLKGHTALVRSITFSSDERSILTGSNDGTARIWDAVTGQERVRLKNGSEGVDARFTPGGNRVVTLALNGRVTVWNSELASVERVFSFPWGIASGLSTSGEFAVADLNGRVRVLDLAGGQVRLNWKAHEGSVNSLTFDSAGDRILTTGDDGVARLWNNHSGQLLQTFRGGHNGQRVSNAQFSPDGRRIVTASWDDSTAQVWDVATGRAVLHLQGHRLPCLTSASFSPDGSLIITAGGTSSGDETARLWDAATGRQLAELSGYRHRVDHAEFDPQGRRIMTQSLEIGTDAEGVLIGDIRIWDLAPLGDGVTLRSTASVEQVAFGVDGQTVVSASTDGMARIWDAKTGLLLRAIGGNQNGINDVALSPDGHLVMMGGQDGTARVWEVATGQPIAVVTHSNPVSSVAFAPDSKRIATASEDRTVVITPLNDPARRVVLRHDEPVADVRFSPDGRYVLTGIRKLAYVWDAESGRLLHELRGHKPYLPDGEEVFGEFSPLGTIVTRSSDDGTGRVWDVGTGRQLAVLRGHQERSLFHASFSPDGHTIITTGQDHTARLWDPESGRMRAVLRGHDGAVVDAAFSPDGRLIATTGYDGTIRIWNSKGQSVTILHAGSRVWRVAFDPQSRRVAAACDDGTVRVYVVGYDELLEMARTRLPLLVTSDARSRRRDSIDPSVWSGKTW